MNDRRCANRRLAPATSLEHALRRMTAKIGQRLAVQRVRGVMMPGVENPMAEPFCIELLGPPRMTRGRVLLRRRRAGERAQTICRLRPRR